MKKIIVAIDGYSGTGKSSTAQKVSEVLNYTYIDSGAMYRAVTHHFTREKIDFTNEALVNEKLSEIEITFHNGETYLNGEDVEYAIRSMAVGKVVSRVAALPSVRQHLVEMQRKLGKKSGVVMDGRDIGTVVFPYAELKLFMIAEMDIRVERRRMQLLEKGVKEDFETIKENLTSRDFVDTTREDSPLTQASDAIAIDTSHLSMEEQVDIIKSLAQKKINALNR